MSATTTPSASHHRPGPALRFVVAAALLPVALAGCGATAGTGSASTPSGAAPSVTSPTPQATAPTATSASPTASSLTTPTVATPASGAALGDLSILTLDGIGTVHLGITQDQALKLGALVNSPGACEGDLAMAPALTKAGIGLNFSKRTDGTPILAMITVSKPGVRLNGKGEVGFNESEIRAAMGGTLVSGHLTTEGRGPVPILIWAGQATEAQVLFDSTKVRSFQLRKSGERFAWDGC